MRFHDGQIWLALTLALCCISSSPFARPEENAPAPAKESLRVRIGVFGLFHPARLSVTAANGAAVRLKDDSASTVLEPSSGFASATIQLSGANMVVAAGNRHLQTSSFVASGRDGSPVDFTLEVPGKIGRHYRGILEIKPSGRELVAIVGMDLETAVASVLASEGDSETPFEALKAQAIAIRSYFVSGRGRHLDFDFCDTTHCQFLREPPAATSVFARAAEGTQGLVLSYNSRPFAAMYTRSCNGHTHTPSQIGMTAIAYPYYSVECRYCLSHPARWTSRISTQDAKALRQSDESSRLGLVRRIGWNTVPSDDFTESTQNGYVVLRGIGRGHGIGLCQAGAKSMAEEGAGFRQILDHYFPNTTIVVSPSH